MRGCCEPGSRVWLSRSPNVRRKYPYSWELVETASGVLVGINTGLPRKLVQEAIANGVIEELQGYPEMRAEVPYGNERSRIDLLLQGHNDRSDCYVEIKNVTLDQGGSALFPDAVTTRGQRHLRELMEMVRQGKRALMFYCVQRGDSQRFSPADEIDPIYGETLRQAVEQGVEVAAYQARVTPRHVTLVRPLPAPLE